MGFFAKQIELELEEVAKVLVEANVLFQVFDKVDVLFEVILGTANKVWVVLKLHQLQKVAFFVWVDHYHKLLVLIFSVAKFKLDMLLHFGLFFFEILKVQLVNEVVVVLDRSLDFRVKAAKGMDCGQGMLIVCCLVEFVQLLYLPNDFHVVQFLLNQRVQ